MKHSEDEIDAALLRAQEEREEREYSREVHGADALPAITEKFIGHPAKLVREYVRSVLAPPLLKRMYETAMGIQTFSTPTAAGNVVEVEASAGVQMATARALVSIGIPMQLGLADSDGGILPGVIALGELEMDVARQESHGERYMSAEAHARAVALHHAQGPNASEEAPPALRPMAERIAAGEFEVTEVDEGVGVTVTTKDDAPPGPLPGPTLEQKLLANRRARRASEPLPYPDTEV